MNQEAETLPYFLCLVCVLVIKFFNDVFTVVDKSSIFFPSGVRYAWRESPCEFKKCAIYESVNSLPGPPFELFVEPPSNDNTIYFTSPHGEGVITF